MEPSDQDFVFPPTDGAMWPAVDPAELGWDTDAIERLLTYAEANRTSGLVVLDRGRLVLERYFGPGSPGHVEDIASAQKVVTSLLTGILQTQGRVRLDDPVHRHVGTGWSKAAADQEAAITLRHLITMSSGLDPQLRYHAGPATEWLYNNPAYHVLKWVLEAAWGGDMNDITQKVLAPLGLEHSSWNVRPPFTVPDGYDVSKLEDTSWLGFKPLPDGRWQNLQPDGKPFTGFDTTARDLARIGLLVLARGRWDGEVILDEAFLDDSCRPSQALNPAYGYLWWLNSGEQVIATPTPQSRPPEPKGRRIAPAAPVDLAVGWGAGDHKLYVVPSLGLVATRMGVAPVGPGGGGPESRFDAELWERLMAVVRPSAAMRGEHT